MPDGPGPAAKRVAVIGGGRSAEHEVSLASAAGVADALVAAGFDVHCFTIDRDGRWCRGGRPLAATVANSLAVAVAELATMDVMVPMVHGAPGEDGALAALAELAGVPCAGSPLHAGAVAMDKWLTKLVARDRGVAVAPGIVVTRDDVPAGWPVPGVPPGPVVVKPVGAGSSYGVGSAADAAQLCAALTVAFAFDDRVIVEQRMTGREIDIAVFRRADGSLNISPPLEIVVADGMFGTAEKYDGGHPFRCPASLDTAETAAIERAAAAMYDALGCAGVARIDFFLTADGPVLNEVNTTPGSTGSSQVPLMYAAAGLDFSQLVGELVVAADVTYRAATWDDPRPART